MTAEIIDISNDLNADDTSDNKKIISMNRIIKLFQNRKMGAFWITFIVLGSSLWTLWNVTHFQSSLEYKNELIQQEFALEREIEEIKNRINLVNFNNSSEHKQYAESRVFENYTVIAEWLHQITTEAQDLGLKVEYKINKSEIHKELNEINILPIELELYAWNKKNIDTYYQKYLIFLQDFFKQNWYINLYKAGIENISGDSSKLQLSIEVYVWNNDNILDSINSRVQG